MHALPWPCTITQQLTSPCVLCSVADTPSSRHFSSPGHNSKRTKPSPISPLRKKSRQSEQNQEKRAHHTRPHHTVPRHRRSRHRMPPHKTYEHPYLRTAVAGDNPGERVGRGSVERVQLSRLVPRQPALRQSHLSERRQAEKKAELNNPRVGGEPHQEQEQEQEERSARSRRRCCCPMMCRPATRCPTMHHPPPTHLSIHPVCPCVPCMCSSHQGPFSVLRDGADPLSERGNGENLQRSKGERGA